MLVLVFVEQSEMFFSLVLTEVEGGGRGARLGKGKILFVCVHLSVRLSVILSVCVPGLLAV